MKLKYDEALSNFAFNIDVRRYMMVYLLAGVVADIKPEYSEDVVGGAG